MDHGGKALIGLAGAHGDALELLEFLEEILDEMPPFVFVGVVRSRVESLGSGRNDRFDAALFQEVAEPIGVISLVAQEGVEVQALDQGRDAGGFPALPRHKLEADQLAQPIDQGQDLGGQAAPAFADRLTSGPPFAPWPWR